MVVVWPLWWFEDFCATCSGSQEAGGQNSCLSARHTAGLRSPSSSAHTFISQEGTWASSGVQVSLGAHAPRSLKHALCRQESQSRPIPNGHFRIPPPHPHPQTERKSWRKERTGSWTSCPVPGAAEGNSPGSAVLDGRVGSQYTVLSTGRWPWEWGRELRGQTSRIGQAGKDVFVLRTSELGFQCFSSFQREKKQVALMSLDQGAPGSCTGLGIGVLRLRAPQPRPRRLDESFRLSNPWTEPPQISV